MTRRSITVLTLAGAVFPANAQTLTLRFDADRTLTHGADLITWTVSLTGLTDPAHFVHAYDFNIVASAPEGTSSTFTSALSAAVNPNAGIPSGANINFVNGGQSTVLDPLNTQFGDVVIGTFTMHYVPQSLAGSPVSYDVTDGGAFSTNVIRIRDGSDFGAIIFDAKPLVISDVVRVIPAPVSIALLGLATFAAARRRR